mmetsp:Transcript_36594/g.85532  ORF Transcript_36594/g.85532 Transcript_36594/m.85532 type:complete len:217 (+) Transcript_36594:212-862(+)
MHGKLLGRHDRRRQVSLRSTQRDRQPHLRTRPKTRGPRRMRRLRGLDARQRPRPGVRLRRARYRQMRARRSEGKLSPGLRRMSGTGPGHVSADPVSHSLVRGPRRPVRAGTRQRRGDSPLRMVAEHGRGREGEMVRDQILQGGEEDAAGVRPSRTVSQGACRAVRRRRDLHGRPVSEQSDSGEAQDCLLGNLRTDLRDVFLTVLKDSFDIRRRRFK